MIIRLILIYSLTFSSFARADINNDLGKFFDSLGYSNVTQAQAYKGQMAGYYTGGSLFARNQVRNVQIASIDMPSFRGGCGGIDMFSGGFSFINADQLVGLMKNVLNNAKGYAFNLAMESATPQIANVMKYMTDIANKVNQANINSCETAAGLVGSVWPKTLSAQRQICADVGNGGVFSDYAAARQGCATGEQMSARLREAKGKPGYEGLVVSDTNIAWKAIRRRGAWDKQLSELLMSLSGSIIVKKTDPQGNDKTPNQFVLLPSLATSDSLLKALLNGGQANIYRCDTEEPDGCLNPQTQTITISGESGFQQRVKKILSEIVNKMYEDKPLTEPEKGLLQSTRLPVYKMLNVQAAFSRDRSIMDAADYADVIAIDILFQYLHESLAIVKAQSSTLQYPESILKSFQEGIDKALDSVRAAQRNAYSQIMMTNQLIEQTQAIEKMLAGALSTQFANTLSWARGLNP
jgi:conjugative transfer pilus assembly protein TraH